MLFSDELDFDLEEDSDFGNETPNSLMQRADPLQPISFANGQQEVFRCPSRPNSFHSTTHTTKSNQNVSVVNSIQRDLVEKNSKSSSRQCVQRRFPGPAGLLPDVPPRSFNESSSTMESVEVQSPNKKVDTILCSQASESAFSEPPFKKLKKDFDIKKGSPLSMYTIEWVKKKAVGKGLKGRKIPFLAVVLQSVDCSSADPLLLLRDVTGELSGTLHREAWQEMGELLRPGAAIVLKQVGVFSTGVKRRQVLLNITMNNIVTIYSPSEDEGVAVKAVQATTTADLVKSIADWQARLQNSPARSNDLFSSRLSSPGQSLFQSVSSMKSGSPFPPAATNLKNSTNVNGQFKPTSLRSEEVVSKSSDDSPTSNFDLFLDEDDFTDIENEVINKNKPQEKVSKLLIEDPIKRGSGHEIRGSSVADSNMHHKADGSRGDFRSPHVLGNKSFQIRSEIALSQAESLILDEVLSGVDLDDFE